VLVALAVVFSAEAHTPTVGLLVHEPGAYEGYTLIPPLRAAITYLIDNEGRLVHSWDTGGVLGFSSYLLEDGSILRGAVVPNPDFTEGGAGGAIERYDWDGTRTWQFFYSSPDYTSHHDIAPLPNGNVLIIAWERKDTAESLAAGRNPALLEDGELLPESILEIEQTGPASGDIVWEWRAWDHLVQDYDAGAPNYGVVADHPELIDLNYIEKNQPPGGQADWLHANGIDYNPDLDQIALSVRGFSEFWVIDHSTTTAEAAGHSGGASGKGGDLLYRWGNPLAYGAGAVGDQQLFVQHDAEWIPPGLPGAGNITVFNNGTGRPEGNYSTVVELVPPVDASGNYALAPGAAYGPAAPVWEYAAPNPTDFYASFISGAVRLPNGNTLICSGPQGKLFEVTPDGTIVWTYMNPINSTGPITQGATPSGNSVFRAYRYAPDYPGLAGQDLTPGAPLELIPDTDADGLSDEDELKTYGTDPSLADTDGDGLTDPVELFIHSDPLVPDTDGDGLADGAEVAIGTYPLVPDTDGDGCADGREVGPDERLGGRRDPTNPWDYFNPTGDGMTRVDDIVAVVGHYAKDLGNPAYDTRYDRTYLGPDAWDLGPPDGLIRVVEILAIVRQFGHDCV
jgi:hypothetical protein